MAGGFRRSRREIDALLGSEAVEQYLGEVGAKVAKAARKRAPKATGRGAKGIAHVTGKDERSAYSRVGYTKNGFYLYFVEVGSGDAAAQPHLRPALDDVT